MKKKPVTTDINNVEDAISWLKEHKAKLFKIKEENNKSVNDAILCLDEAIDAKIKYLQEVLTQYEENPQTNGTAAVVEIFEDLSDAFIKIIEELEGSGETDFDEEALKAYCDSFLFFVNYLYQADDNDNEKVLQAYLYLSKRRITFAMIRAAYIYRSRKQYKDAQRLFEEAASFGSDGGAEGLMEMVDYGFIPESDLKDDYGIKKINCAICGNTIHEIEYFPCKICGWAYTFEDTYLKEWEREDYNMMSRRKAKKLYQRGLTIFKDPLPYFNGQ